jgi:hypothetical protein
MKLQLPALVLFLLSPPLAHSSPRLRPTLFATTKKPASLAGFLYLILSIAHLNRFSPSRDPLPARPAPLSCLFKLQVVSNRA